MFEIADQNPDYCDDNCLLIMASRNVSASCDNDEGSDSEVTSLMSGSGASIAAAKPLVHYGDRMPYRQGTIYILIMLLLVRRQ